MEKILLIKPELRGEDNVKNQVKRIESDTKWREAAKDKDK